MAPTLILSGGLAVAGCGTTGSDGEKPGEDTGPLVVSSDMANPPFSSWDEQERPVGRTLWEAGDAAVPYDDGAGT